MNRFRIVLCLTTCLTLVFECIAKPVDVSSPNNMKHRHVRIRRQGIGACPVDACANEGTCVERVGGYTCLCPHGYISSTLCRVKEGRFFYELIICIPFLHHERKTDL